jgi:hypothetical protein
MSDNRPKGFYVAYLERIGKQREQAGLPPAPDIAPPEYWDKRRKDETDKDCRRKAA